MNDFARSIVADGGFMPHGMCYLWEPKLLWLHVVSDALTGLAYWAIPPALFFLVWKAREEIPKDAPYGSRRLPYDWMFLAFALFIVACGTTHFMGVWTIWDPSYWLSGGVKAVTAVASVATAVALPPLIPRALDLIRDARDSELRRTRLEATTRELEELYERLREADRLKSELVANVSHELRTPLSLILGPTDEMLRKEELSGEVRRGLEVVRRNARSLLGQVDDLLDASRLDLGEVEPSLEDLDLARLVEETATEFEPLARTGKVRLTVETPETLPLRADPEKTERVLLNLLSNAFKFTPEGGRIHVLVESRLAPRVPEPEAPEEAVLEVRDSGEGVPPEARETIFERFRQAEGGSTRRHRGTGLGLAIAREYLEMQGGTIEVDDAPEGGARFTVRLPLRRPEGSTDALAGGGGSGRAVLERARLEASAAEPEAGAPPAGSPMPLAPARSPGDGGPGVGADTRSGLLVVEDDPGLREFLAGVLGSRYDVRTAEDGVDALRAVEQEKPDVIVTDVMMPRVDGEELLDRLRDRPELDDVPVLVLTAKADAGLVSGLLGAGAQDYILKPVGGEELLARIENHLDVARSRRILQEELASREDRLERLAGQAAEQKRRLETMLREKSLLVRELHHRVKGNLQTVSSLLNLQVRRVQEVSAREALEESRGRIAAMALLHEKLYQTDDPTETGMDDYLRSLVRDIFQSWGRQGKAIRSEVDADGIELDAERAVTCGLLVHELVTNALRHGFPDERAGRVVVHMERIQDGGGFRLAVEDDGVGFPDGAEPEAYDSLGLNLSRALVDQLDGTIAAERDGGVRWRVEFPAAAPEGSGRSEP